MQTVKTADLIGTALDWAVAKCEGQTPLQINAGGPVHRFRTVGCDPLPYRPATDWAQGGPIIERETITVNAPYRRREWFAWYWSPQGRADLPNYTHRQRGPTPLVAAMRCYVASKLGDTVEIPEGLQP